MDIKRFTAGTIIGAIVLFLIGNLFCWVIFADFYAANAGTAINLVKERQNNLTLILSQISYAMLLTYMIEKLSSSRIVDGLKVGATLGFFIWFTVNLQLYSFWNISSLTTAFVDPLIETIRGAVSGAIIAAVMGLVGSKRLVAQPQ